MSHDLEALLADCVLKVIGPRNLTSDLALVRIAVRRSCEEEAPYHLPDDAERLAGAIATHLRLEGLATAGDPIAPALAERITIGYQDAFAPYQPKRFGLGVTHEDTELLLTLLQNRILEIDAWALEKEGHNKRVDAVERELVVSLKNSIAEGRKKYG